MGTIGKTLIIGDTHFRDKYPGYLDAQIKCIKDIILNEQKKELFSLYKVVFLGDFFDSRKPTAIELLKVQNLLKWCEQLVGQIIILVGNHETYNKSDDGIAVTNLFQSEKITIINKMSSSYITHYIPYYEDEKKIIDYVKENVKRDSTIFGHFGVVGLIDTYNDYDFTIVGDILPRRTILGHIHGYTHIDLGGDREIIVVGTPYHTSYQEEDKENYYAVLENDKVSMHKINHGVRYKTVEFKDLIAKKDELEDINFFTVLKILVTVKDKVTVEDIQKIISTYKVGHIEIKYKPIIDAQTINYSPANIISNINDHILEEYLSSVDLPYKKQELLKVLKEVNDS